MNDLITPISGTKIDAIINGEWTACKSPGSRSPEGHLRVECYPGTFGFGCSAIKGSVSIWKYSYEGTSVLRR